MYNPSDFREERLPVLQAAIGEIGFATLVTAVAGLQATHLPMWLAADEGPHGTLYGHVARANKHWKDTGDALAIFLGPYAYISPSWYPGKREHGREVPTWNYISVHAHGRLETIEEPAPLRSLLTRLVDRHERGRAEPWHIDDAPPGYIEQMLRAIVGLRLPIEHLEGKWKLGQNRPPADREGVIAGLRELPGEREQAIAEATRQTLPD